jgi:sn-glycerol 3-phosphate transport system ATP-binding protein
VVAGTTGPIVAPAECAGMTLGVRPEHLTLALDRGLCATVERVEYLGADSLLSCRAGTASLAARVAGSVALAAGDTAWLVWAPGAQHLFDHDGRRRGDPVRHPSATLVA